MLSHRIFDECSSNHVISMQGLINAKTQAAFIQSQLLEKRYNRNNINYKKPVKKFLLEWKQSLISWEKSLNAVSLTLKSKKADLEKKFAQLEAQSMKSYWQSPLLLKYTAQKGIYRRRQAILDQLKVEFQQSKQKLAQEERKASFSIASFFSFFCSSKSLTNKGLNTKSHAAIIADPIQSGKRCSVG